MPWQETADGVLIPVRAQPGARRNAVAGCHDDVLKVAVTQVAERGKANRAIVETVAKHLGVRKSQVSLVRGETQRDKLLLVTGIPLHEIQRRITPADALNPRRRGKGTQDQGGSA